VRRAGHDQRLASPRAGCLGTPRGGRVSREVEKCRGTRRGHLVAVLGHRRRVDSEQLDGEFLCPRQRAKCGGDASKDLRGGDLVAVDGEALPRTNSDEPGVLAVVTDGDEPGRISSHPVRDVGDPLEWRAKRERPGVAAFPRDEVVRMKGLRRLEVEGHP
jgi:hypothetical protein